MIFSIYLNRRVFVMDSSDLSYKENETVDTFYQKGLNHYCGICLRSDVYKCCSLYILFVSFLMKKKSSVGRKSKHLLYINNASKFTRDADI